MAAPAAFGAGEAGTNSDRDMPARTASEGRALRLLARVVADGPFRACELIDRVCAETREAFGFKRVEWRAPHHLVPVPGAGDPPPNEGDLSVLSALGEATAAVADRARGAGYADRAKSEFLSVASHELRAPIAVVHGIAGTLHGRGEELEQEQVRTLVGTLFQQTGRLRDLADQLLDLSRIDSHSLPVHPERFNARRRLEELLARIAPERADDVRVEAATDREVVTDAVAFERVAANLVLNALRYGRPPVRVRAEQDGEFRLVVEDRGEGVPKEFVPRLFERFTRSDDTRRSGTPGAGLGLAIAAAYARAIGGRLRYEPAQPRGARFTLSLPAARS
jgi:signal transduction histidine kinase